MMFKKAVLVIASLFCLTQLALTSPAHATVRIMLLGDSITEGSSSGVQPDLDAYYVSYRMGLRELLTAAGYDVDFVGSLNFGSAVFADADHKGHGGWDAAGAPDGKNIDSYVYAWLEAQDQRGVPVDIVLLHIGTNDVSANAAYASDVAAILNEIDRYEAAFQRDVWVVVALIIKPVSGIPRVRIACAQLLSMRPSKTWSMPVPGTRSLSPTWRRGQASTIITALAAAT